MLLEMRSICKDYPQGKDVVHILKNISLEIDDGDYLAIMGPSGSGKTTLMNIIGCLDTPTSGTYVLAGEDVSSASDDRLADIRNQMIGFVFQSFYLLPKLTALDNVALPLLYANVPRRERRERAAEALASVGLEDRMDFYPNQLSGGQCQRVAIARAMIAKPRILLADEPTGALDSASGRQVMQIFGELNAKGTTVVLITHAQDIADCAKKIHRILDGELIRGDEDKHRYDMTKGGAADEKGKITFLSNLPEWLRRTIAGVLIAALIGGGVYGILLLVRGSGGKVKVYPIMEFCTNYADDQAETQGLVKPDKMQSIYVSETQKITKYYVHEGDTVKVGDPILSYDTTLTDLQLERARISVQKLEIALDEANANLVKVNNYRLYVPQPIPLPDEEPDTPLTPVEVPYFRGGSGTKDSPFFYIWSNNCAYDSAFIDSLLTRAGGSTAYVVFEVHDGDSPDGDILRSWGMVFVRQSDGSVAFKVDEAYGRFDDGTTPDDGGDIDDGGNTYIDTTPSYT